MGLVNEAKIDWRDLPKCNVADIELQAENLDVDQAVAIFKEWGCLVVRGLGREYAPTVERDLHAKVDESIALLDQAVESSVGWSTPNGCLFLPAPEGFVRKQQVMVLPLGYTNSAAFMASANNPRQLDIVEGILGPDFELSDNGQSLCKEPCGGHPKMLHQDASYFTHKYYGPVAVLQYAQKTTSEMGALNVVPGSFKLGLLPHIDTFSHLGLDLDLWPWEAAVEIEGEAGDAIFFHVNCIHGSQENHSQVRRGVYISRYRHIDDFVIAGGVSAAGIAESQKKASQAKKKGPDQLMARGFRPWRPPAED